MSLTNSCVQNLYCPKCQAEYSVNEIINLCQCGSPLLVNYDYKKAAATLTKESLLSRENSMWRFIEVLPVLNSDNIVSLGEGGTKLLRSKQIGTESGLNNLFFKDESTNPTGSFKARGLGMAVSKAKELGIKKIVTPTAGNAGSALAAYASCCGIETAIFMPKTTPAPFMIDCKTHGARVELVEGSIKGSGEKAALLVKDGWFSVATLKEPYRIEGKKTMGYEIAEQFEFDLPEIIIYPTGGGTGLIGMWKAFDEMEKIGWISSKRPKMISVQSEGCAPIVKAFNEGKDFAELWENPQTAAAGLRVPGAIGDFLILDALRKSSGTAVSVSENDILKYSKLLAEKEGIFTAPEGGAALAALMKLKKENFIKNDDRIVVFITGSGYKYLDFYK